MAKISLRAYVREVEGMVDSGRIDEAIGHCRYILNYFPKHIDSYRLLGKAYLEVQRYGDAADILQRVLSAIPDDFIAHLGMSIIREDEGNTDAAIWHMERAFEVQPSNAAIQSELRRLFGRRDGVEPPKIQLTRGALARMYAKGSLYPQAIAELRAALAEDPRRPDLEVILARMYYLNGQRIEAAETCSSIHTTLPFCLEANLLLAEILQDTERAAEAQAYRHRVQRLDPYAAHVSKAAPTPDKVPDSAVTIEKLDWTPGEVFTGGKAQPDWATSLGVDVDELVPGGESLPEWLNTAEQAEPEDYDEEHPEDEPEAAGEDAGAEVSGDEQPDEEAAVPAEDLPDWMKSAGWEAGQESQETEANTMDFDEEAFNESGEDIEKGDIPDWLKDIAPEESTEDEDFDLSSEGGTEFGVPSWLEEAPPGPSDSIATWLDEQSEEDAQAEIPSESPTSDSEQGEIPDWLKDIDEEPAAPGEEPETEPAEAETFSFDETTETIQDIPDWLRELSDEGEPVSASTPQEEPAALSEETEEWTLEMEAAESQGEYPTEDEGEPAFEEEEEEQEPVFEMDEEEEPHGISHPFDTKILAEDTIEQPEFGSTGEAPDLEAMDQDATMAWLESLAAKQGASEEELLTNPDEREEAPPAWVKKYTTELNAEFAEPEAEAEEAEEIEEGWIEPEFEEEPEEIVTDTAEAEFLSTEDEDVEAKAEQAEPEMPEIPDWLLEMEGETPADSPAPEVVPDWLKSTELGVEETTEAPEETVESVEEGAPQWIEKEEEQFEFVETEEPALAEEEAVLAESEPEEAESIPDWLKGIDEEFTGELDAEQVTVEPSEDEMPDWLKAAALGAAASTAAAEELPEWIHGSEEAEPLEEVEAIFEDESFDALEPEEISEPITGDTEPVRVKPAAEMEAEPEPVEEPGAEPEPEEEVVEFAFEDEGSAAEEAAETGEPEPSEIALDEEEEVEFEFEEEPLEAEFEEMPSSEEEIPAWLSEFAEEEGVEEIEAEEPAAEFEAEAEVEPEPEPEGPRELLDVNTASLSQLESLPGVGFITAQNIVNYRENFGPFNETAELKNVTGVDQEALALLENHIKVEKAAEAPQPAEIDLEEPGQVLEQGRALLREGEVDQALEHYNRLIGQKQDLDTVIEDLQDALFNHPMNIALYQSLGDAHMRSDQLQAALDVYTKAEELLR